MDIIKHDVNLGIKMFLAAISKHNPCTNSRATNIFPSMTISKNGFVVGSTIITN